MAVERACLEVLWVALGLALLEGEHARTTTEHRMHVHARRHGKATRPLGAHEGLVPREGNQVYAQLVHIDGPRTRRLGAVEKDQRPCRVRRRNDASQLLTRKDVAREVRSMREADETRAWHDGVNQGTHVEHTATVCRGKAERHAPLVTQAVERPKGRVVVPVRGNHAPAVRNGAQDGHIERLGGIGRKDQSLGMAKAEKCRDPLPR